MAVQSQPLMGRNNKRPADGAPKSNPPVSQSPSILPLALSKVLIFAECLSVTALGKDEVTVISLSPSLFFAESHFNTRQRLCLLNQQKGLGKYLFADKLMPSALC